MAKKVQEDSVLYYVPVPPREAALLLAEQWRLPRDDSAWYLRQRQWLSTLRKIGPGISEGTWLVGWTWPPENPVDHVARQV